MSIGERITELRKAAELSQGQLAAMLDVSRQAVSKWENDQTSPDTLKLIQLADILRTEVEYLATGKHPPEPEVVHTVEVQEKIVEKVVEKPVVQYIEKPIVQYVEKLIPQIEEKIIEKPVIKRVVRIRYFRNPIEYILFGSGCFLLGILMGILL